MSAGRGKGKRLREEQYSFRRVLEEERRREKRRLEGVKGEEKGVKGVNTSRSFLLLVCCSGCGMECGWLTGLDLYRPYRDHTFFRYEVEMTREAGDQEERYVLSVSGLLFRHSGWGIRPKLPLFVFC